MTAEPTLARIALMIATRTGMPVENSPTYRGAHMAIDALAARDTAPFRFDLAVFDDAGVVETAAELARQAVDDKSFVAAVGPMGSDEAFADSPVFDEAGMLQVSPCASHPELCRMGLKTFFRLVPNEETQGSELAKVARRYLDATSAAVVADNDKFGMSVAEYFTKGFVAAGGRVATLETLGRGTTDFSELAQRVAASSPDVVFYAVHAVEGGLASSAVRAAGVRVPFLGTDGLKTSFFLGGGDALGDSFHTHTGTDFRRLETALEFGREYSARFPPDSTYSPEAFDAVMLVAEAVLAAGSTDRGAVLRAFRERNGSMGITGRLEFDKTGERIGSPVSLYKVVQSDGQREMSYLGTTAELCPSPA